MIYFIGDMHLEHENIIEMCARPYSSIEEMNRDIINRWNRSIICNRCNRNY